MGLAEQMLAGMSVENYSNEYVTNEEEHIVVNESRQIIVPSALKTIAVTGDKDVETVTFDCVRFWDGNDLSTFAIYLNYVLPDGKSGTYIPPSIFTSEGESVYHFDWEIKNNITKTSGKIAFAITAIKTTENELGETVVDKQWSSFPNSDCSIVSGLPISNVPDEEESQDVLAQLSEILENIQGDIDEFIKNVLVQSTGNNTNKAMSQYAVTIAIDDSIKQSKQYTDEKASKLDREIIANSSGISRISKRLTNVEKWISPVPFETDSTVAYIKDVPDGALPYAEVSKIGGMTHKSKNLFVASQVNKTALGLTFSYDKGYIKINGTKKDGANVQSIAYPNVTLPAGTYTISCKMVGGSITPSESFQYGVFFAINKSEYEQRTTPGVAKVGDVGTRVITLSEPTLITSFDITPDFGGVGTIFNNALFEMQFEAGDTVTTYQDGFDGLRDSKVTEVNSIGANVLNIEGNGFGADKWFRTINNGLTVHSFAAGKYTFTSKDNYLNITAYDSSGYHWLSRFVELEPNTNYRLTVSGLSCIIAGLADNAVNTVGTQLTLTNKVFNSGNYRYWMISFYGTGAGAVMISKGEQEQEFSPYRAHTLSIPLSVQAIYGYGWGVNGTCYNSIEWGEDSQKVFNKLVGKAVFNGSENWVLYADNMWTSAIDALAIDNAIIVHDSQYPVGMHSGSTKLKVTTNGTLTVDEFKAILAEKPMTVYYQLSNPTTEDISNLLTDDNMVGVEPYGTLTFENEYGLGVPSDVTYQIKEVTA